jgi:GNAT superfamily N-acetyltransferase
MAEGFRLQHATTAELESVRQLLIDVYAEVYADRLDDPFFSVERFNERLSGHAGRNNWEAVIAYTEDGEPVGYAYAAALQPGARWWMYQLNPLPEDYTEETGDRTLALFEIMVRQPWRGTGIAQQIHEELLSGRPEERVTLLVDPRKSGVKRLYEGWGYEHIGDQKPFPDSPVYATMVRQLRPAQAA